MRERLSLRKMLLLLLVVVYNFSVYFGTRVLAAGKVHHKIGFAFEENIPLVTWMVYIYVGCYLFWVVNYILGVMGSDREAYRMVFADMLGKTVCLVFYVFLPTTMQRPEIVGDTPSAVLLRNLYAVDAADNLFPSIHCLVSWISYLGVRGKEHVAKWYQVFSCLFALAVCVSTLTVKQHVLIDVIAGVLLAEAGYLLGGKCFSCRMEKKVVE